MEYIHGGNEYIHLGIEEIEGGNEDGQFIAEDDIGGNIGGVRFTDIADEQLFVKGDLVFDGYAEGIQFNNEDGIEIAGGGDDDHPVKSRSSLSDPS